ncbi:hypothetical protein DKE46_003325 [Acinetobacter pittii]|nr:hypothetical protein DKE46_003325 [Acinetobacter pittii]
MYDSYNPWCTFINILKLFSMIKASYFRASLLDRHMIKKQSCKTYFSIFLLASCNSLFRMSKVCPVKFL